MEILYGVNNEIYNVESINEQQITLVAARGDSNKAVDIKKSDVEDDMKNYIPPDDL